MRKLIILLLVFTVSASTYGQLTNIIKNTDSKDYPGFLIRLPNQLWPMLDSVINLNPAAVKTEGLFKNIGDATKDYLLFVMVARTESTAKAQTNSELLKLFSIKNSKGKKKGAVTKADAYKPLNDYVNLMSGASGGQRTDDLHIILFDNKAKRGKRLIDETKEGTFEVTFDKQKYTFNNKIDIQEVTDLILKAFSAEDAGKPLPEKKPIQVEEQKIYDISSPDNTEDLPVPPPPIEEDSKPLEFAESMPTFPGGEASMIRYLSKSIIYPEAALKSKTTGTVIATFIVETDGMLSDIKILRGVSDDIDKEALRVIKNMPKWQPGIQNGRNVRVKFRLPIKFELD